MNREDYREKQKKYREMAKSSAKWIHISVLPQTEILGNKVVKRNPLLKGRTYRKGKEDDKSTT